jgi:predicted outer membrane repeat protein
MIEDSEFVNGTAYQGGAIYIQGESNVTLSGVSFKMNKAVKQGGAIFANRATKVNIIERT